MKNANNITASPFQDFKWLQTGGVPLLVPRASERPRHQQVGVELLQLLVKLVQLVVGLLHDGRHVLQRLLVIGRLAQLLRTFLDDAKKKINMILAKEYSIYSNQRPQRQQVIKPKIKPNNFQKTIMSKQMCSICAKFRFPRDKSESIVIKKGKVCTKTGKVSHWQPCKLSNSVLISITTVFYDNINSTTSRRVKSQVYLQVL